MALNPLRSEQLRNRVELMRAVRVDTGKGSDRIDSWVAVRRPWAEVLGQNGREAVIAQALQGVSVYQLRIWWMSDIKPSDQIRLFGPGGLDLNITSISDPFGTRRELMILASTEVALPTS